MSLVKGIHDTLLFNLNTHFTEIPVIKNYQGYPEPNSDYGVLGVTTFTKLNRDSSQSYKTDTGFEERVKQEWNVLLTLDFYGDSCYDNAFEASAWLASRDTQEILQQEGCMSIIDVQGIRRIPEMRDTGYIERASLDFNILIGHESIRQVDWFDTVRWEGTIVDQADRVIKHWSDEFNIMEWYALNDAVTTWVNSAERLYDISNTMFLYL